MHSYVFICYLAILLPLSEYAQSKENQIISQKLFYVNTYIYLLFLPYTNFRALHLWVKMCNLCRV
jgi:hypothetical protein